MSNGGNGAGMDAGDGGLDAAGGFSRGASATATGGFGGGGGAGMNGGGGGGGYSGGGGGSGLFMGADSDGGGGGGSFIAADFLSIIEQEMGVNAGNGLVTINQISVTVPAPLIGRGLPVLLAVGGILFGTNLSERSRKRSSRATAIPHTAA